MKVQIIDCIKEIKKKWLYLVLCLILLLTPFIGAFIIQLESGTSIFRYDAWNTTWNDEPNYNITIREIREYITPQNVRSYNEQEPEKLGYGVYRPTTYIPYVLMSLLTGTSSHNYFVYCNILFLVLSNVLFLWIVHPKKKQIIWLIVSISIMLPMLRYVWSGMTEGSHIAMAIVMTGCGIYLFREDSGKTPIKEKVILIISIILPLFFGMIRGYQFFYLLIPVFYFLIMKRGIHRIVGVISLLISFLICLYLYISVLSQYCCPYFSRGDTLGSTAQFREYISYITSGRIWLLFSDILNKNVQAFNDFVNMARNKSWYWITFAAPLFLIMMAFITLITEKTRDRKLQLIIIYTLIVLFVIEGIFITNKVGYIARYFLGIWVGMCYLLCATAEKSTIFIPKTIALISVICLVVFGYGKTFSFPQQDYEAQYNDVSLSRIFEEIMPRSTDSPWDNTIASGGNIRYLRYLYPSYIANSTCQENVLEELVKTDSVKSRYISLTNQQGLIDLCDAKYELIYDDYGLRLYKVR